MRIGDCPGQKRTLRDGLSYMTVPLPTKIASLSERKRWAKVDVIALENRVGLSDGYRFLSIKPSVL